MPIPGSIGSTPASETEALARQIVSNPRVGSELISDVESFLSAAGRAAGAAAATGGGSAEIAAAEDAGEVAADFLGWGMVACVLLFIVALRLCERMFVHLASLIPFKGGDAARTVQSFFRWLDNLENSVIHYLISQLQHLIHQIGQLVLITLELNGIDLSTVNRTTVVRSGGTVTQGQISYLQKEIDYLRQHLGSVQYVTTNKTVTVGIPANLWDQIHHIESQLSAVHHDLSDFNTRMSRVEHETASLQRSFDNLSQQVHAVRAIATGWQDIERQLEQLGTTVSHFIDTSTAELDSHHRSLVQLAPLGLLLQPGIRGLKTLRQLEDTPCMCPKLPNVPRLQPELLAMYEFLTHG